MTTVYYSRVIDAPAEAVWAIASDFGALARWFPFVTASELEPRDGARLVGAVRTNHIDDGSVVVERLTALSDQDRRISYDVVGGDAPVQNYGATLTVYEISDTETAFVTWTATFDTVGEPAPVAEWVRNGIFRDCLVELERVLRAAAPA